MDPMWERALPYNHVVSDNASLKKRPSLAGGSLLLIRKVDKKGLLELARQAFLLTDLARLA